jgi:hypothetical protein
MRLLVHRGQVLLLLVVGVLAGVAICAVCLELDGVPVLAALRVTEVFKPPRSQLPSEIVIGGAVAPSTESGLDGPAATPAGPDLSAAASPAPVQPSPTTAVVPGAVYTYPPDSHGGHGGHGGE